MRSFRIEIPQSHLDDLKQGSPLPAGPGRYPASAGIAACRLSTSRSWPTTGRLPTTGERPRHG